MADKQETSPIRKLRIDEKIVLLLILVWIPAGIIIKAARSDAVAIIVLVVAFMLTLRYAFLSGKWWANAKININQNRHIVFIVAILFLMFGVGIGPFIYKEIQREIKHKEAVDWQIRQEAYRKYIQEQERIKEQLSELERLKKDADNAKKQQEIIRKLHELKLKQDQTTQNPVLPPLRYDDNK